MQYVQTAAAIRQVQVGQEQVWQLHQLNAQMQMQQRAAAFQANLEQALFETEQMAKRVAATLRHDLFAAAILSHYHWLTVASIRPELFTDVQSKRAWADAAQILTSTQQRGQMEPSTSLALNQYVLGMEQLRGFRAILGDKPESFVAHAEATAERSANRVAELKGHAKLAGGAASATLLLAIILSSANSGAASLFWLIFLCLGALAGIKAKEMWETSDVHAGDERRLESAQQHAAQYAAFQADPNRGAFLQRAWTEHPLLFTEPVPQAPAPGEVTSGPVVQTYVERQLVERQVVVTRCKFCQQMTPVDGHTCQHCGAPGFGG